MANKNKNIRQPLPDTTNMTEDQRREAMRSYVLINYPGLAQEEIKNKLKKTKPQR